MAHAVVAFVYGPLADNPRRVGKPLQRELAGQHATRRGTYRIRYRILDETVEVEVIAIAHRSDAYRP